MTLIILKMKADFQRHILEKAINFYIWRKISFLVAIQDMVKSFDTFKSSGLLNRPLLLLASTHAYRLFVSESRETLSVLSLLLFMNYYVLNI